MPIFACSAYAENNLRHGGDQSSGLQAGHFTAESVEKAAEFVPKHNRQGRERMLAMPDTDVGPAYPDMGNPDADFVGTGHPRGNFPEFHFAG